MENKMREHTLPEEKVEKFQGLTFINVYEEERDDITLNCFKRDMLNILNSITKN